MRTRHFGATDPGLRRSHNEDAFLADERLGLFIVCDGVGGRAFGEVAAQETVEIIWEWVKREAETIAVAADEARLARRVVVHARPLAGPPVWVSPDTVARLGAMIRGALQNACYLVHGMAEVDANYSGMSTTASVVLVAGELAIVGQVGDSRVYLARGDDVHQLTEDHTLLNMQVKLGLVSPEHARGRKSSITRAIGLHDFVEVDILAFPLQVGDRLLLCSDGLHEYLDSADTLTDLFQLDARDAAPAAVAHANACGGKDNITALFVELLDSAPGP
ncbi:serine/threonine-protein phosphatase [Nannocystis sp. ILAH1]|uniref:PP2C family protein-serine/threonine phosphatase n=1 Tax=unclassified Nannocystis TaxID=2627009 RepID=UPI00226E8040|nr:MULTISPECIES: PP2C family serine/threonine-protein phosphatase [unclassified Nannocystis]MCY0991950.1 serine/threonine-protein phosphatase [Nannocystis sp. ILAH1]MCY1064200.1 serine/threonine-protein phosphatase [Nannocystis sp. RBIL2]